MFLNITAQKQTDIHIVVSQFLELYIQLWGKS